MVGRYICPICKRTFEHEQGLRVHVARSHKSQKRKILNILNKVVGREVEIVKELYEKYGDKVYEKCVEFCINPEYARMVLSSTSEEQVKKQEVVQERSSKETFEKELRELVTEVLIELKKLTNELKSILQNVQQSTHPSIDLSKKISPDEFEKYVDMYLKLNDLINKIVSNIKEVYSKRVLEPGTPLKLAYTDLYLIADALYRAGINVIDMNQIDKVLTVLTKLEDVLRSKGLVIRKESDYRYIIIAHGI